MVRHLTPEILLTAYRLGSFPMAGDRDDPVLHWLDPPLRGIIPLDGFHIPRSLKKAIRKGRFALRVDAAFGEVIRGCAASTPARPRTWLNDELIKLYEGLHRLGHAHSVEAWQSGRLVGGLYGVKIGAAFFGESMFSRQPDASKAALVELVARLRASGFMLLDTQFLTEHLTQFGALEIPRGDYKRKLRAALLTPAIFPTGPQLFCAGLVGSVGAIGDPAASSGVAHSSTQTS